MRVPGATFIVRDVVVSDDQVTDDDLPQVVDSDPPRVKSLFLISEPIFIPTVVDQLVLRDSVIPRLSVMVVV